MSVRDPRMGAWTFTHFGKENREGFRGMQVCPSKASTGIHVDTDRRQVVWKDLSSYRDAGCVSICLSRDAAGVRAASWKSVLVCLELSRALEELLRDRQAHLAGERL